MSVLGELQPNKVFKYFEEICSIPHGSRNLQQISDYLVDFAKAHELKYRQDEDLNVIIWKDGSKGYEASEPVILQGHMDMVAVKEADCDKDMEKEGLDLEINGDYISAKGTSLGGDDGIAVAYTLAVLDDEERHTHQSKQSLQLTKKSVCLEQQLLMFQILRDVYL